MKISNNENVKFDASGKVISARQERPETTIHELPELELCKQEYSPGVYEPWEKWQRENFFSVFLGSSLSIVISLILRRLCVVCTQTVALIKEQ
jgi:hypothetical protein